MQHISEVENRAQKEYKHKKGGFALLLREALSNAIHSVLLSSECTVPEVKIEVQCHDGAIVVSVSDNGQGFNEKNYRYFKVLDSTNEEKSRSNFYPQGQGRLAIVYFADGGHYSSVFKDEDGVLKKRSFDYPAPEGGLFDAQEASASSDEPIGTTLSLYFSRPDKYKRAQNFFADHDSAEKLKNWILGNFMPFFLSAEGRKSITLETVYNTEKATIQSDEMTRDLTPLRFELELEDSCGVVKEFSFFVWIVEETEHYNASVEIITCARGLIATVGKPFIYKLAPRVPCKAFITSSYFDENVTGTGDRVEIPEEAFGKIQSEIERSLDQKFDQDIDENRRQSRKRFDQLNCRLPMIMTFIDKEEICLSSRNSLEEKELLKAATEKKSTEEVKFFRGEKSQYEKKVISSGLCAYVKHREKIFREFERLLEVYEKDNPKEKELHDLICPSGDYDGREDYFRHNLWIVDDKFSYFSFTRSADNFESQCDIAIHAYADNNEEPSEIVFIELKRPSAAHNAGSKHENMIDQMMRYASDFYKSKRG